MGQPQKKSGRESTAVFGVLLIVLIIFVSGILYYTFVMRNISFATNTFSNQMTALLINSFRINATRARNTYNVKLGTIFNTEVTFQASF